VSQVTETRDELVEQVAEQLEEIFSDPTCTAAWLSLTLENDDGEFPADLFLEVPYTGNDRGTFFGLFDEDRVFIACYAYSLSERPWRRLARELVTDIEAHYCARIVKINAAATTRV
jgi:hypothetical protein